MERAEVTFDDVALYFTEEEWLSLQEEQKSLYKEVMNDNYQMILSQTRPDIITNIELGCEPYITTAKASTIRGSWQGERLAVSDRSILQENIHDTQSTESTPPLKRQRRYPRVNPFRWIKKHKKSKSRSHRSSRRSEQRENGPIVERNYETPPVCGDVCTDQPDVVGEGHSELRTEDSSDSVQTSERESEPSCLQTEDGNRSEDQSSRTIQITGTQYKPDLRVTLSISEEEPGSVADRGEGIADLEQYTLHTAEAERATSSLDTAPFPEEHTTDTRDGDGHTESCGGAASPQSLPKTTEDLTDAGQTLSVNEEEIPQEKTACEGMASPRKKGKRVHFSDTITTFIIEPEDSAEREFFDSIRLQRKVFPRIVIVSVDPKGSTTAESIMVTRSQGSKPKATQPEQKTTVTPDTLEGGRQDLKSQNSKKCNNTVRTVETVEAPSAVCRRDTAEPSPSTGPLLQSENRGEEYLVTKSQDLKPNSMQAERETTTVHGMLGGENQELKSQNSMKCNKTMKTMEEVEGSSLSAVCEKDTTEPPLSTGPGDTNKKDVGTQIDPIHKEEIQQPANEIQLTPPHPADEDQNFVKSYSCSNCGKITHWTRLNDQQKTDVEKSFLHVCRMCNRQRDKGVFSPQKGTQNTTPTKCATSGKNVTGSPARKKPYCALLADSPETSPTAKKKQRQEVNGEAETVRSSTNPNGQLKKGEEASSSASTNHDVQLKKGEDYSLRTSTGHNVQLKKGEASPSTSTNHNVLLEKGEEASPSTLTNPNVQPNKGEEASLRTTTNHNVQPKKGEEASLRTTTNHNVQPKKGEEASVRTTTNHNVQPKKGEEASLGTITNHNVQPKKGASLRTATSHNVQLRKGEVASPRTSTNYNVQPKKSEASPRTSSSPNVQLKTGEEASPKTSTSHNVKLKKGEASPRTSSNHHAQVKKGEASPRTSTSHNVQLKKGEEPSPRTLSSHSVQVKKSETSPRTSTSHNVQLKKGEEASPRTLSSHSVQVKKSEASPRTSTSRNVQLKKGEEASPRTSTNQNVQLKKVEASPRTSTNQNVQLKKVEASPRTSNSHTVQLEKGEQVSQRTTANLSVQLKKGEESLRTSTSPNVQVTNGEEALLRTSASHNVQLKKNGSHYKKCYVMLEATNFDTDKNLNLCSRCRHCGAQEDAKVHHKVKASNETPTKSASTRVHSNPDLKTGHPEKRKSNKTLQNEPCSIEEQKITSDSKSNKSTANPRNQKNDVQARKEPCVKCGKLFLKRQKTKPLASIQQKRPIRVVSTIARDKMQKPGTKSNPVRKERVKKSPGEPKRKKPRNAESPKSPKPPRGARDKVLCTKCGKRLALHVAPSQDGPSEGNDENECVVLPRKKRKRPLAGMEPFTCKECGKIFTRHFTLLQHRLIHTGERPYACKVCRKTFRDSSYLIVHMRSHTKEKPYSCTQCGKCFSQNSALHVHLRTHTDERPFRCQDCGKNFTDRSTYRHHRRIHTGEKPYACSYCGKKFTQQPHMKRHETIHTGERPFECVQCGKRFIERTKLKKHQRVHQKEND